MLAILLLLGLVLVGWIAMAMFSIALIFFFWIFSTARAADAFAQNIMAPAVAFLGGAWVFGGMLAILSAAFASGRIWYKSVVAVAIVGGLATVLSPPLQNWLAAQAAPANAFMKKIMLTPMK